MNAVIWKNLPTILYSDELLDKAYGKAKKAAERVDDSNKVFRVRKQMNAMIRTSSDVLADTLMKWVHLWPSLDHLSEFDYSLLDATVGADNYRKNLGAIQWASNQVRNVARQNVAKITRTAKLEVMHESRREAYGRISSVIHQVGKNLEWLATSRLTLGKLPTIDTSNPCIVIAGAPNVGKSAMISALSSAAPEVASYPFTTKELHVGHFINRRLIYQLVDTPGLLDRPMDERNEIEMQAIAALEHTGSLVVFLMDYSGTSGTDVKSQVRLLGEVKSLLSTKYILEVDAKADLLEELPNEWEKVVDLEAQISSGNIPENYNLMINEKTGRPTFSAEKNVGLELIRLEIIKQVTETIENDPLKLPDNWPRSDISDKKYG